MADFTGQDLTGSRFDRVDLSGASFRMVNLSRARLRAVYLNGTVITGAEIPDLEITGEIGSLRVNGVDVAPLVDAELDRRDPDRARMRPTDAAGFREAWAILERRWAETVESILSHKNKVGTPAPTLKQFVVCRSSFGTLLIRHQIRLLNL